MFSMREDIYIRYGHACARVYIRPRRLNIANERASTVLRIKVCENSLLKRTPESPYYGLKRSHTRIHGRSRGREKGGTGFSVQGENYIRMHWDEVLRRSCAEAKACLLLQATNCRGEYIYEQPRVIHSRICLRLFASVCAEISSLLNESEKSIVFLSRLHLPEKKLVKYYCGIYINRSI